MFCPSRAACRALVEEEIHPEREAADPHGDDVGDAKAAGARAFRTVVVAQPEQRARADDEPEAENDPPDEKGDEQQSFQNLHDAAKLRHAAGVAVGTVGAKFLRYSRAQECLLPGRPQRGGGFTRRLGIR